MSDKPLDGTVVDIDGNVYKTVKIGTQVWMAENLKVTRYRNGNPIPNVLDDKAWRVLSTGAYSNYNNDENLVKTYGRLYNWHAVSDSRGIAPKGWHIPSDEEWTTLTNTLGGDAVAGGEMKEAGTEHWLAPNKGANNKSGFNGLPGGMRNPGWGIVGNPSSGGNFDYIGKYGHWHTSTEYDSRSVNRRYIVYDGLGIGKWDPYPKESGFSIRCVRDLP